VDRMPGASQFIGKREEPGRLPLRMVKTRTRAKCHTAPNHGEEV
jgi:hypothetical protein